MALERFKISSEAVIVLDHRAMVRIPIHHEGAAMPQVVPTSRIRGILEILVLRSVADAVTIISVSVGKDVMDASHLDK